MNAALQTQTKVPTKPIVAAKPSFATAHVGLLQRKCACGGAADLTSECEDCDKKKLSLQRSTEVSEPTTRNSELETLTSAGVPPIVHEVLRSPGQPLDARTRAFMESRFSHDFSRVAVGAQSKLVVNEAGDRYEQEADRRAHQVMRASAPAAPELGRVNGGSLTDRVQRRADSPAPTDPSQVSVHGLAKSPLVGSSSRLDGGAVDSQPDTRSFETKASAPVLENTQGSSPARFDFGNIRVHADGRAAEAAHSVNAQAFTLGSDIVFGAGQYAPETDSGRFLVAHELAHVMQQAGSQSLLQRTDWGLLGGKCCNSSPEGAEWALVDGGSWTKLEAGACTGSFTDCDGLTCGGGFYQVTNLETGECKTPRRDSPAGKLRRWTPNNPKPPADAVSPTNRGCKEGDTPAGYTYDSEPIAFALGKALNIQPGDVVVRAGTFSGMNPLVDIIGEDYNHGGVALDSGSIHHVESNGYETVSTESFFDPANASGGAVIRFDGPLAMQIRARVVEIVRAKRYVRIPGNPFSTSENLKTVNCNEFVHELFRQSIAELIAESKTKNVEMSQQLLAEYGDPSQAKQVKSLISDNLIELNAGLGGTGLFVSAAEGLGSQGVKEGVKVEFEGSIETRNLYPRKYATSGNLFKNDLYAHGFYDVAVLRAYTPDSFVNSKYFSVIHKIKE